MNRHAKSETQSLLSITLIAKLTNKFLAISHYDVLWHIFSIYTILGSFFFIFWSSVFLKWKTLELIDVIFLQFSILFFDHLSNLQQRILFKYGQINKLNNEEGTERENEAISWSEIERSQPWPLLESYLCKISGNLSQLDTQPDIFSSILNSVYPIEKRWNPFSLHFQMKASLEYSFKS